VTKRTGDRGGDLIATDMVRDGVANGHLEAAAILERHRQVAPGVGCQKGQFN